MDIEYPVYVLLKDCNEVRVLADSRGWDRFEAIDIENNEYDAWDNRGQKLILKALGVTRWKSGTFTIEGSGEIEAQDRFRELKARSAQAKHVH